MTGDLPAAALRLMAALPVRTHERKAPPEREGYAHHARECVIDGVRYESLTEAARQLRCNRETLRKRIRAGNYSAPSRDRGGHNKRAVIIKGVRYASLREAQETLHVGNARLYAWLDAGEARYAGKHE